MTLKALDGTQGSAQMEIRLFMFGRRTIMNGINNLKELVVCPLIDCFPFSCLEGPSSLPLCDCAVGDNEYASFCSAHIAMTGGVCSTGEHGGCGASAAGIGVFCGSKAKKASFCCCESGWLEAM